MKLTNLAVGIAIGLAYYHWHANALELQMFRAYCHGR
jgi:hypothetical protein